MQMQIEETRLVYASSGPGLVIRLQARAGKYKLVARAGKCKLEARTSKYKLGARTGKYKLGPAPVNTNWVPGLVNTNWGPGSGPEPGAKQTALGREMQTPFFYITKKSGKNMNISKKKQEHSTWNIKHFSSFLKDFQLSQIVSDRREDFENKYLAFFTH